MRYLSAPGLIQTPLSPANRHCCLLQCGMEHQNDMNMLLAFKRYAEHRIALRFLAYHNVILGRIGCEGRGIDIKGRRPDVSVDDSHRSVGQCQCGGPCGFLQVSRKAVR